MKIVIQRVKNASVTVAADVVGRIGPGALVFLGIETTDTEEQLLWMADKAAELRMFADSAGKMNLSASEAGAEFLVVSQFTLIGDCRKGRRPSFDKAAGPEKAEPFYNRFIEFLRAKGFRVESGIFRADMDVELVNDGPVTFIIEN